MYDVQYMVVVDRSLLQKLLQMITNNRSIPLNMDKHAAQKYAAAASGC